MPESPLPPLNQVLHSASPDPSGPLAHALAVLFEPSPTLTAHLVPELAAALHAAPATAVPTYAALVDAALALIARWDAARQAHFVAGHPRIGEQTGLSALSAAEQAARATPPAVLARLRLLNALYEARFPGLRYITFVNGRARADVLREMEAVLGLPHSLSGTEPPVESVVAVDVGGEAWTAELERAVRDVGRIAKNRLAALGAE